jgi:hypothetical protein
MWYNSAKSTTQQTTILYYKERRMTKPFDYVNAINYTKKDIMETEEDEGVYNSFLVNRSLSYFGDTAILANEMNISHHIDNRLQFSFLINIIRKRKRFSKWLKPETHNAVDVVKAYYGYSNEKAEQILPLLSPDQIKELEKKVNKGGRK